MSKRGSSFIRRVLLKPCKRCGAPRLIKHFVKWRKNGTISQALKKDFRIIILHDGFMDSLFSSVEARLGIPIDHIAYEAQRNSAKAVFEVLIKKIPLQGLFLRSKFIRNGAVDIFHIVAAGTGMCYTETIEYKPGEYGLARVKNPYNIGLMVANVVGAFEAIEKAPYDGAWQEESKDVYLVKATRATSKTELAGRMVPKFEKKLPGKNKYGRCRRCRVPSFVSEAFQWIPSEGMVLDRRTGARMVFVDGYMVETVFRELESELGEAIYSLVVEAQRDWTVSNVGELGLTGGDEPLSLEALENAYNVYLRHFPLYGYGNLVDFKMSRNKIEVTVENPFDKAIIAGTLRGMFEALEKSSSNVSWVEPSKDVVVFTISPT